MRKFFYLLVASALFLSCNNSVAEKTEESNVLKTDHFVIHFTDKDSSNIDEVAKSLENNYNRIITSLNSPEMPVVHVHYYKDIQALKEAVKDVEPNLPDFAIGLATNASEIHLLSPNHDGLNFQFMVSNTIHEFAHCVSLNINSNFANKPRWLWEAIAQYEAGQQMNPKSLPYLLEQTPPSLHDLSQFTNTYVYEVGYYIAEYLVATKGEDILNELILNNGDIETSLGMTDEELTQAWFTFVKEKYEL